MKREWFFLTVLIILGIITGCGKKAESPAASSEAAGSSLDGKLVIWEWDTLYDEAINKIITEFNQLHPRVSIVVQSNSEAISHYSALAVAIQSNTMPDLFVSHGSKNEYLPTWAREGLVMNLDGKIDTTGFDTTAINFAKVDNKLYASPGAFADSFFAFYNKKIFEENGIEVPKTWAEFLSNCETLKKNGITPISLHGADIWGPCMIENALSSSLIPEWCDEFAAGTATVKDERFKFLMEEMKKLAVNGYFSNDFISYDEASAIDEFVTGNSAMFINGQWNISSVNINPNVDVFYLPSLDGTIHISAGISTQTGFSVAATTKSPEAALEFLKFYMQAKSLQKIADIGQGGVPLREGVTTENQMMQKLSVSYDVSHPLWLDMMGSRAVEGVDPMTAHLQSLQNLLAGRRTVDEVIAETAALMAY
jgi:raffinose/stachyose/melibiose transport system substrate-binding protein